MNCEKCAVKCNTEIRHDKKFCDECKCSYLCHYNYDLFDKLSVGIMKELCQINKHMIKNIEESSRLAKTFGVVWLPIGIQPSEVDRFLKYFPTNSDNRKAMFLKSEARCTEIQFQIPIYDRCFENLTSIDKDECKSRCEKFFSQRKEINNEIGRLDHLDKSEGKGCHECLDVISFGEICVMLPKQLMKDSLVWHPNCFKCIQCQHLLIDYFFCWDNRDNSGPYCLRHFDDRFFPRCCSCDELIFDDEYASVLDESFHTSHLKCSHCDTILANTQFVLESESSQSLKQWKCVNCLGIVNEDSCLICRVSLNASKNEIVTVDGLQLHKKCACCESCKQILTISDPTSFIKDETNHLLCADCHSSMKTAQCQQCKESIDLKDKHSVVSGRFVWHNHCLHCFKCQKNICEENEFTVINRHGKVSRLSKPTIENASAICKECFINQHEDLCEMCGIRIDDEGVNYNSRLFHKPCFKCFNCLSDLDPTKFTTKDDKFYCICCYSQSFCHSCFSCKLAIVGTESNNRIVNFETRYWHEKCFICYSCNKPLFEMGFLFDDDKISCTDCGSK